MRRKGGTMPAVNTYVVDMRQGERGEGRIFRHARGSNTLLSLGGRLISEGSGWGIWVRGTAEVGILCCRLG